MLWAGGGNKTANAQPADAETTGQPHIPSSLEGEAGGTPAPTQPTPTPTGEREQDPDQPPPEAEGQTEGAAAEQVITRAWVHDDYGRIVFDWPQTVSYTASLDARLLTVEFDRQMHTDFAPIRHHLGAYISQAVLDPDGRTFTATLTGDYHLRTFPLRQGGMTKIVLDLRKDHRRVAAASPSLPSEGEAAGTPAPTQPTPPPHPSPQGEREQDPDQTAPPEAEGQTEGAAAEQVITRAWAHDNYGRIVFDWPQTVSYTASLDARLLTVEFDRQMHTDFAPIRHHLGAYISQAVLDPDGRTFTATLTGDYHLRTFPLRQGGMTKIVLDLRKDHRRAAAASHSLPSEGEAAGTPAPTQTAQTTTAPPVDPGSQDRPGLPSPEDPSPQTPRGEGAQTPGTTPRTPTSSPSDRGTQTASPTPTGSPPQPPFLPSPPEGKGEPAPPHTAPLLTLPLGHSRLLRLAAPAGSVFIGNPDIADVSLVSSGVLHLVGKAIGRTSVAVLDAAGEMLAAWTVATVIDVGPVQTALEGTETLKGVSVRQLSQGLELSGTVASSAQADLAVRLAVAALPSEIPVTNRLIVSGAQQVNLEVQIAEMNRSVSEALGINWEIVDTHAGGGQTNLFIGRDFLDEEASEFLRATLPGGAASGIFTNQVIDGSTRVTAMLDALATAGLVSVLARPSLTAVSGETASFFSGGEFPLPAGFEDGAIIFTYKKFGVLLDFVPTVVNSGRIVLTVRSEVSQRSETEALRAAGVDIPVIDGRRAETTVEVGNGESIVIAGLYRDQSESRESGVPLLKDIPIVNLLFGTRSVRSSATELIIVVTARLTDAATIPQGRDETFPPVDNNRDQPSPGRRLRGYYY